MESFSYLHNMMSNVLFKLNFHKFNEYILMLLLQVMGQLIKSLLILYLYVIIPVYEDALMHLDIILQH